GTQGARVILLDTAGNVIASEEETFALSEQSREEQSPVEWWNTCFKSLKNLVDGVKAQVNLNDIIAIAATSTSGTVIPLDADNQPLHGAIMYSDKRSAIQGEKCTAIAEQYHKKGFTSFNASSGLAKMVWFVENFPKKVIYIKKWIHAADYIIGKLSGNWGVTDYTNAFKSGYDVSTFEWPSYLYEQLPLKKEWLPEVVASGTIIGKIATDLSLVLGLPEHIKIAAGITDGCASQIASGAMNPGDWNTTIGTTMVIKGVTINEVVDLKGRLYSHRHPAGYWMPGGASNTGADWVTNEFGDDLKELNSQAERLIPTGYIAYPLMQQGERFPMISPQATGFIPEGLSKAERFTANMEGVAYLERYAYDLIEHLSGEQVNAVFTAGGGSNSTSWLTIRSNVLNRPIYKMKYVTGAVGAAILAASNTYFNSIIEAAKKLTIVDKEFHPKKELARKYDQNYIRFLVKMQEKGFIPDTLYA
ncbi:MAG: carbohydrate kinase, partial [Sphingobacteriaceae bacterium]